MQIGPLQYGEVYTLAYGLTSFATVCDIDNVIKSTFEPQVSDLRRELESRNLSSKGLKSQLIARLTKAVKTEQEKEEEDK